MSARDDTLLRHARARAADRTRDRVQAPPASHLTEDSLPPMREDLCGRAPRYAPRLPCSALRSSHSNCDDMYEHGVPPAMFAVAPPSPANRGWKSGSGGCHARVPGVGGPCTSAPAADTPCGPCAGPGCGGCDTYLAPFPVALGYAAYVSPSVSPTAFQRALLGPFRVAIPASCDPYTAERILDRINSNGARNSGYTRIGDVLVPAYLNAEDRRRVALSMN